MGPSSSTNLQCIHLACLHAGCTSQTTHLNWLQAAALPSQAWSSSHTQSYHRHLAWVCPGLASVAAGCAAAVFGMAYYVSTVGCNASGCFLGQLLTHAVLTAYRFVRAAIHCPCLAGISCGFSSGCWSGHSIWLLLHVVHRTTAQRF